MIEKVAYTTPKTLQHRIVWMLDLLTDDIETRITQIAVVLLVGCGTTMKVTRGELADFKRSGDAKGEPFYVKRGASFQETVYLEPLVLVALTIGRPVGATQESQQIPDLISGSRPPQILHAR